MYVREVEQNQNLHLWGPETPGAAASTLRAAEQILRSLCPPGVPIKLSRMNLGVCNFAKARTHDVKGTTRSMDEFMRPRAQEAVRASLDATEKCSNPAKKYNISNIVGWRCDRESFRI